MVHGHCFVISGWILDTVQFISGQISNRELIALCDLNSNKEPSRNQHLVVEGFEILIQTRPAGTEQYDVSFLLYNAAAVAGKCILATSF